MSTVLIIGSSSLLGKAVITRLHSSYEIIGTYTQHPMCGALYEKIAQVQVNMECAKEVEMLFLRNNIDIVVLAASVGDVALCEKDKEAALRINVLGISNVVHKCYTMGIKLIYISSSSVFDGKIEVFSEKHRKKPLNFYGHTKSISEDIVLLSPSNVVLRLTLMYGWNNGMKRHNFVTNTLEKLSRNEPVLVANDRRTNPIYYHDVAKYIEGVIQNNLKGCFNVGGKDSLSRYEMAILIAKVFNIRPSNIVPTKQKRIARMCEYPKNEVLSTTLIESSTKIFPRSFLQGLECMKEERQFVIDQHTYGKN